MALAFILRFQSLIGSSIVFFKALSKVGDILQMEELRIYSVWEYIHMYDIDPEKELW